MSNFLTMWEKIKELTPQQQKAVLNIITPCTGESIKFRGLRVSDLDLAEALLLVVEDPFE